MAEEANFALTDPTTSAAEMEHPQQDSDAKAADKAIDVGTSDVPKEGADKEEVAKGIFCVSQIYHELRLTIFIL